jgi:hypothetical protein
MQSRTVFFLLFWNAELGSHSCDYAEQDCVFFALFWNVELGSHSTGYEEQDCVFVLAIVVYCLSSTLKGVV